MLVGPGVATAAFLVPAQGVAAYELGNPFIDFSRPSDKVFATMLVGSAVLTASAFGVSELMLKSATRGLDFLNALAFMHL